LARWDDPPVAGGARQSRRGLGAPGHGSPDNKARRLEAGPHRLQHGGSAAGERGDAGDVKQQPVHPIDGGERRPARGPEGEALQQIGIGQRIGRAQQERRADRLGVS
jgi:hypothetical protein